MLFSWVIENTRIVPESINKPIFEKGSLIAFKKDLEKIGNYCPSNQCHAGKWSEERRCVFAGILPC